MRPPIPILLTVRELGVGGCERDLTRLALHLDRTVFEPHVGCFLSEGVRGEELRAAGVPIVEFPVKSFLTPQAVRGGYGAAAYMRRHGIRLIHAFDVPTSIFGIFAATFARVPARLSSALGHRDLYTRADRALLRIVDLLSTLVIVNCEAVRDDLAARHGLPRERTYLSYNGVDTEIFRPARDAEEGRAALPEGLRQAGLVIGCVSALRPEKDIGTLIRAFAALISRRPDARLAIVGSGSMEREWRSLCGALSVADRVHFEPTTPRVEEWMRGFDIAVLPSLSESFPNSLLESMACGCAVVGSRVGGVPEMIEDGVSGLLFRAGDAEDLERKLDALAVSSSLRAELSQAGAARARALFALETAVARNEELYLRVLRAKRAEAHEPIRASGD